MWKIRQIFTIALNAKTAKSVKQRKAGRRDRWAQRPLPFGMSKSVQYAIHACCFLRGSWNPFSRTPAFAQLLEE
jgi:hypothetical protein